VQSYGRVNKCDFVFVAIGRPNITAEGNKVGLPKSARSSYRFGRICGLIDGLIGQELGKHFSISPPEFKNGVAIR
jgi:hypothetical protein